MNMRQLQAFRTVFQVGTLSHAAEMLHTSQPSMSRLIGELEISVGFTLFIRSRRGMVPTIEGRRFHEAVEKSFIGIERLRDTARIIATSRDDAISVGAIPSVTQTILPKAIDHLQTLQPKQRVNVTVGNTASIINAVLLNEVDIGVVSTAYTLAGVESLFEFEFKGICLIPESHRLAASETPIDLWQLLEGEFVSYDRPLLETMGLEPSLIDQLLSRATITSHSAPTLASIARDTSRLAVVDQLTANAALQSGGLVARKLFQQTTYGLALIKRPGRILPVSLEKIASEVLHLCHLADASKNTH